MPNNYRLSFIALIAVGLSAFFTPARAEDAPAATGATSIDFRKLKELIPEKLGDIKRTECKGERTKVADMSISTCTATFSNGENKPAADINIVDYGAKPEMAQAMAAMTMVEIDKDTDDGYEKTVKVATFPAYEKWNKESKHGEIIIFVGKRYLVTVNVYNLTAEQTTKLAESLPLDKLAALK